MTEFTDNSVDDNPIEGEQQSTNITNTTDDNAPAPQTWHDAWREDMAQGDEKELKRLQRFSSPVDVYKFARESEKRASAVKPQLQKPEKLGEDSSDADKTAYNEQLKAYREQQAVPDEPSGYNLDFEDGTVIGEDIKPMIDGFLEFAHEANMSNDVVKGAVGWYLQDVQRHQEEVASLNDNARVNGIAELKSEWGGEFQGNMNAIHSLFTDAPEGTIDALLAASDEKGLQFGNNPDNIKWLVGLAKKLNPTATLLPPGQDPAASIEAELDKLTKQMHSDDPVERAKYWSDEKAQARFLQLSQAKQTM